MRGARPAIERFDVILRVKRAVAPGEIAAAAAEGSALVDQLVAAGLA